MAKDSFSFDVVSQVDLQELTNAIDQARREISTRFDFKNTDTNISRDDLMIEIRSSTEDRLKAAIDVLKEKMVKRQVPLKGISEGPILPAARGTSRQNVHVNQGISDEKAKEMTKLIRGSALKVQAQIQGDQVRVSGKKKDDLQDAIQLLKDHDFGIALQFVNFRP